MAEPTPNAMPTSSSTCRSCGSANLKLVYDFGPQPLAGTYPLVCNSEKPSKKYDLDLTQCRDCGLLQVTNIPPIDEIFHADYRYSSSTVPDLVRHFEGYTEFLEARLAPGASVLEFGCNDGVLLEQLQAKGFDCVGVDASDNVASVGRAKGIDIKTGFLNADLVAAQNLAGRFDLVTCSNVFAHIDDISETVAAVKLLLKKNGLFAIEVHDGKILAEETQFDTVYHEHLTYFTEATLRFFVEREGFEFVECAATPMHGGGLRFVCRYDAENPAEVSDVGVDIVDGERFTATIERCRDEIIRLKNEYGEVHGYGAAGRAQMFINMTRTGDYFSKVFDDSPFRQDRFIIGTDIPIVKYEGEKGGCCIILAWNYAPTISARIRAQYEKVVTLLPDTQEF